MAAETIRMNGRLWILIAVAGVASCSQTSALQSGTTFGCRMSAETANEFAGRICQGAAKRPIYLGEYQTDAAMLEQNNSRTIDVSVPVRMPNGDIAAELLCEINTKDRSVTYTRVTRGPTTNEEADYLRTQGACAE